MSVNIVLDIDENMVIVEVSMAAQVEPRWRYWLTWLSQNQGYAFGILVDI